MIPEIGNISLIIALAVSFILASLPMVGAHKNNLQLMQFSRYAVTAQFFLILVAFIALAYSFTIDDEATFKLRLPVFIVTPFSIWIFLSTTSPILKTHIS